MMEERSGARRSKRQHVKTTVRNRAEIKWRDSYAPLSSKSACFLQRARSWSALPERVTRRRKRTTMMSPKSPNAALRSQAAAAAARGGSNGFARSSRAVRNAVLAWRQAEGRIKLRPRRFCIPLRAKPTCFHRPFCTARTQGLEVPPKRKPKRSFSRMWLRTSGPSTGLLPAHKMDRKYRPPSEAAAYLRHALPLASVCRRFHRMQRAAALGAAQPAGAGRA